MSLLFLFVSLTARAQYTANYQTNIISGILSNWTGNYIVGSNTTQDALQILAGGTLIGSTNAPGYIGYEVAGSNNSAVISGPGSLWSNTVYVGYYGSGNGLVISSGGNLVGATLGFDTNSCQNAVLVTGTNSSLQGLISIGSNGWGNSLVVSDGAGIWGITLGGGTSSSNNAAIINGGTSKTYDYNVKVGDNGPYNSLIITNGGDVFVSGRNAYAGYNTNSSGNRILVTGVGSKLETPSAEPTQPGRLFIGYQGPSNQFVVSRGGWVNSTACYIGYSGSSSNNQALITDPGSVWIGGSFYVGQNTGGWGGNSLVISNGGEVLSDYGFVGQNNSNTVVVTGSGSVWSNLGTITIGNFGSSNSLVINDGGKVFSSVNIVGTGAVNSVVVTGSNSLWNVGGTLTFDGYLGSLVISNGGQVVDDVASLGPPTYSNSVVVADGGLWQSDTLFTGNTLIISGGTVVGGVIYFSGGSLELDSGSLIATNGPGTSYIDVGGNMIINGGATIVNAFLVSHKMLFSGGTLSSAHTSVYNNLPFVVGNGTKAATFSLMGGTHTFQAGLQISTNAQLTGCGEIYNTVVNYGLINETCPGGKLSFDQNVINYGLINQMYPGGSPSYMGNLSFLESVTNFGSIIVTNGADIEFYGPVVNNGSINALGGVVNFYSTFINNGTLITSNSVQVTGIVVVGTNVVVSFPAYPPAQYDVQTCSDLASTNWSTLASNIIGSGSITNFTDVGGAVPPRRFYRIVAHF